MDRELLALSIGLATFVLGASAGADEGRSCVLETLDDPDGSLENGGTSPYGINDGGLVTGNYVDDAGSSHGMLYLGGRFHTVDHPRQGPLGTYLYYANQDGLVAGAYYDANGLSHSALYDTKRKEWRDLPDWPGATANLAGGVDAFGRASGNYTLDPTQAAGYVAWVYDGRYHTFIAPASDQSLLGTLTFGMRGDGTVVGYYLDSNGVPHGFTRAIGEQARAFDVPGATSTYAFGTNDRGALTGYYFIGSQEHGYVYRPGQCDQHRSVTNFDYPGAVGTVVAGVDDGGDIVGFYLGQDGYNHGFIGHECLDD
jgi:hypothetical protein